MVNPRHRISTRKSTARAALCPACRVRLDYGDFYVDDSRCDGYFEVTCPKCKETYKELVALEPIVLVGEKT